MPEKRSRRKKVHRRERKNGKKKKGWEAASILQGMDIIYGKKDAKDI
jgi:hypothetical protein